MKRKAIPDSRACYCTYCGQVYIGTDPVGSLKEWAKDIYEAMKEKEKNGGSSAVSNV